jgi:hypothetical protein
MSAAYEEFVDFIAGGSTPESVIAFQPSQAAKDRVEELIYRGKTTGLSTEEASELNHCMLIEHVFRLAKARARLRLAERG